LTNSLTYFTQHTKQKPNRWLGTGVSNVGTSSFPDTSRMRRVLCLWWWTFTSLTTDFNTDPNLNGHLHYPNDIDTSLNEDVTETNRKYRSDYDNNPPDVISFMSAVGSTSGRLHREFVLLLFLQTHRGTDRFYSVSGVQLAQHDRGQFHYRRVVFSSQLRSKWDNILDKTTTLRITLNKDGAPIVSQTHTHPSHSQTSRLLTSSSSLGVPVPHTTQFMWDV
jgi:hypothetical protein